MFGHSVLSPGEAAHHWDSLNGAWMCYVMQVCTSFTVLAASFTEPVSTVRLLTTMRGQMAPDPVELWAFNTLGQRIQRCRVKGIDIAILASGVLPPPTLYMSNIPCGKVLQKKNCSGQPGNCDFVVEMEVRRHQAIGMVWFAGPLYQNSYANADALSYEVF